MRDRRRDIEAAKGLAILLVVFGHLVARHDPMGVHWYEPLRRAVYAFHMPLFLYLSGLVAVESGLMRRRRADLPWAAAVRAKRLLVPFFGLGVLTVLTKLAAARVVLVDNPPSGLASGLLALVWDTAHSPALSIWYLFVLFVVSLGTAAVLDGQPGRLRWLLAAALAVFWVHLPAVVYLDRVGMYAPFFLMGVAAGFTGRAWDIWLDRFWPWAMVVLLCCLGAVILFDHHWDEAQKLILLPVGAVSLPAIHGMFRSLREGRGQTFFLFLGRYSFMIYLFNTLSIGAAKGMMLHVWSWNGPNFPAFAAVLMCAGLAGPVLIKRYAFRRVRLLDRMTD